MSDSDTPRRQARAITSGQNKKAPEPQSIPIWVRSWALALDALASLDVQEDLPPARPAVYRQSVGLRLRSDPQEPVVPPTLRAGYPSVLYDNAIIFVCLATAFPHFLQCVPIVPLDFKIDARVRATDSK